MDRSKINETASENAKTAAHLYKCARCGNIFKSEGFAEKCPNCGCRVLIHEKGEQRCGKNAGCGGNCSCCGGCGH